MAQIVWTEPAVADLSEIAEFIALDKPDAAAKLVSEVIGAVEKLSDFPLAGRLVPEFRTERYREVIVAPCRVIYRGTSDAVIILRVIRGERLLRESMFSEN